MALRNFGSDYQGKAILFLHGSVDMYGASRIFLNTVLLAKKLGYLPIVVLSGHGELNSAFTNSGIEVLQLNLGILRRKYSSLFGIINRLYFIFLSGFKLSSLIRRKKISLIYSNTTAVLIGSIVARLNGVSHIWHIHEIIDNEGLFTKFISCLLKFQKGRIIAVSEAVKRHWAKYIRENKIDVIYNGLDYSDFIDGNPSFRRSLGISTDVILIAMIGRVNLIKGQQYFLDIAENLIDIFDNVGFVLIGNAYPGSEYLEHQLDMRIKQSTKLNNCVINLGYRDDIADILKDIDIYVQPSILPDSLPTTILEAMASERPVITTVTGGSNEMVLENETGFYIPVNKPKDASKVISKLINDEALRRKFGLAGRQRVLTKFSLQAYEAKLSEIFASLIK